MCNAIAGPRRGVVSVYMAPSFDMLRWQRVSQQPTAIKDSGYVFDTVTHSHHMKSRLPITYFSVTMQFWNLAQSTVVSLPSSVANFKMMGRLKRALWTNEISRDLSVKWVSGHLERKQKTQ